MLVTQNGCSLAVSIIRNCLRRFAVLVVNWNLINVFSEAHRSPTGTVHKLHIIESSSNTVF